MDALLRPHGFGSLPAQFQKIKPDILLRELSLLIADETVPRVSEEVFELFGSHSMSV